MKTKLISCLFLFVLCFSLQAKTKKSNGSKNTTNVVWNSHYWGFDPGSYNEANFEAAFPDGIFIGHGTKKLSFTSYSEIVNFLNSESYQNHLSSGKKLNTNAYNNFLAKQLIALTLSIGFDFYNNPQFLNSGKLANFKIQDGFYKDKSVQQFLKIANGIYGDNSQTSSIPNLVSTAKLITQKFSGNKTVPLSISGLTLLNDVKCYGGNNGREKVTVYGGVSPFTFTLSNGNVLISASNSVTFSNLLAGNYTVIVTDSLGNTATGSNDFTISEPSMLMFGTLTTNVTCNGLTNGTATVIPSGGTAPYTILWNTGSTSLSLTNLAAGTYTAMLTDANACCKSITVYVDAPEMLMASASSTNISCYGGYNGSVTATASGGTAPYSILWSNGSTSFSQTGLLAGTYTAIITDANGCISNISTEISQPSEMTLSLTSTDVYCYGGSNGSTTVSATNGTAPYTIVWDNGATTFTNAGLSAGTHTAVVTDANGCYINVLIEVNQPSELTSESIQHNPTCCMGNSGTTSVTANGGTAPYTIIWSNGSTDFSLAGLYSGTYTYIVSDANGCTTNGSVTIVSSILLSASVTSTNLSCFASNNGTATTSVTGGTAPYTILWSNGSTSFNPTGLSSGTHTAIITDYMGCTANISVVIEQPYELVSEFTSTNPTCCSGNNGTATATASGGTQAYSVLWSNGATSNTITGLSAGTYTCWMTDANGCTTTGSVTIVAPSAMSASVTTINVLCHGGTTGSATVVASGGTAPYTILWSNGSSSFTNSGLSAGTHTAIITDYMGCTANISVVIEQPYELVSEITSTNPTCCSGNNGTATATASGGTPAYSVLWSNGATSNTITGLSAGTYTCWMTDANGCTTTGSVTIVAPSAMSASVMTINILCHGGTTGSATVVASGGTAPYTILWSNGSSSFTNSDLTAGTHTAIITDYMGCTANISVVIEQPYELVSEFTSTNPTCCSGNNGTATATASGGTPAYSVLWSNGATSNTITGLSAGTYTCWMTDANGCTTTGSVTIVAPSAMSASVTTINVLCHGGTTGSATVVASGGTAPYTIIWSNGSSSFTNSDLSAGTHTAIITDYMGCTANISVEITQPEMLMTSYESTNVLCYRGNNGTANVSASGGTAPYTILWSNASADFALTGLSAGTYTAVVTDANGCTANISVEITQPEMLMTSYESTNVLCYGDNNGTANVSASGGTAPYTILWSNASTDFNLTGLSAGTYTAVVTDANGCTANISVEITQPELLMTSYESTNVLCYRGNNGTANVSASGGTAPYTILWSNASTDFNLTGLSAGTYAAIVTDANGCTTNISVEITQPEMLMTSYESTNVLCYGDNNGTANVSASGGTAPYTILWSNASTDFNLTGLSAGTYTAVVTDANGCTANISVEITQPEMLMTSYESTNILCYGDNNGTANVSASGGTSPYTILWSNASTDFALTGLSAGTYTAIVTDANGCTANISVEITQPEMLMTSYESTNVLCYGDNNGTANVSASGGTAPYTILWSNASTDFNLTGLSSGTYTAVVTDANGCTANISVEITQPLKIEESIYHTNPDCSGENGTASAYATGGTEPYTYSWSNGATTSSISGLSAGLYTVIITDSNGCTETATVVLNSAVAMITNVTNTNVNCFGSNTASATVTVTGGTAPHNILWNNGGTSFNPTNLIAGTYTAVITDSSGCKVGVSVTITEPEELVSSFTQSNPSCCGGNNATITVVSSGGTPKHSILWNNGNTNFIRTGLSVGTYTYTVTDSNGCSTTGSVTILNVAPMSILITKTNITSYGGYGTATATVSGGTAAYSYKWYSSPSQYTQTASLHAGTWKVRVTDANGCISYKWVTLTYGSCSGYVTLPRASYGESCTDEGGYGCYLADNFANSFPNGLMVGSANSFLNFDSANAISNFLPSGNFYGALNSGIMQNPTATNYSNGLAAQAIALTITLSFNNNNDFSAPTSPMGELFVSSGIFVGKTVNQMLEIANSVLGGENSNYSLIDIFNSLDAINRNFENGTVDLGYLVLTNPSLSTNNVNIDNPILSYVVYPNPVTAVSKIEFSLTFDTSVNIQVYDLNGRMINEIFKGQASSGQKYNIEFNSNDLASGTYFIKLVTDKNVYNKSVLVSK